MKSMQPTTTGFVLTSLSFKTSENKKNTPQSNQQFAGSHKSSIAKFDYCLPPEEGDAGGEIGFGTTVH